MNLTNYKLTINNYKAFDRYGLFISIPNQYSTEIDYPNEKIVLPISELAQNAQLKLVLFGQIFGQRIPVFTTILTTNPYIYQNLQLQLQLDQIKFIYFIKRFQQQALYSDLIFNDYLKDFVQISLKNANKNDEIKQLYNDFLQFCCNQFGNELQVFNSNPFIEFGSCIDKQLDLDEMEVHLRLQNIPKYLYVNNQLAKNQMGFRNRDNLVFKLVKQGENIEQQSFPIISDQKICLHEEWGNLLINIQIMNHNNNDIVQEQQYTNYLFNSNLRNQQNILELQNSTQLNQLSPSKYDFKNSSFNSNNISQMSPMSKSRISKSIINSVISQSEIENDDTIQSQQPIYKNQDKSQNNDFSDLFNYQQDSQNLVIKNQQQQYQIKPQQNPYKSCQNYILPNNQQNSQITKIQIDQESKRDIHDQHEIHHPAPVAAPSSEPTHHAEPQPPNHVQEVQETKVHHSHPEPVAVEKPHAEAHEHAETQPEKPHTEEHQPHAEDQVTASQDLDQEWQNQAQVDSSEVHEHQEAHQPAEAHDVHPHAEPVHVANEAKPAPLDETHLLLQKLNGDLDAQHKQHVPAEAAPDSEQIEDQWQNLAEDPVHEAESHEHQVEGGVAEAQLKETHDQHEIHHPAPVAALSSEPTHHAEPQPPNHVQEVQETKDHHPHPEPLAVEKPHTEAHEHVETQPEKPHAEEHQPHAEDQMTASQDLDQEWQNQTQVDSAAEIHEHQEAHQPAEAHDVHQNAEPVHVLTRPNPRLWTKPICFSKN
ncbi:zonadhesin [Hexamita inflata]|uniref:Zonadhesin n=1 Tax=Hexamita inflata TaxID=28002 RepID=A0AA86PHH4_9EUKA|nr:zonadhesin [Hexamita inflata]